MVRVVERFTCSRGIGRLSMSKCLGPPSLPLVSGPGRNANDESTKLETRYKGPCVITEVWPCGAYKIQYLAAKGESKRPTTAHMSQLKIW